MAVEILMPELGESVHEGTVSRWLKNVGDFVKEDEPVVEIMTDKVNTELPAPATGILVKITIAEGDQVEVFSEMGVIEEDEAKAKEMLANGVPASTSSAPAAESAPAAATPVEETAAPAVAADGEKRWYTPLVRAMAKEHGLNDGELAMIAGTGQGGRVTKSDVETYLSNRASGSAPTAAPAPVSAPAATPTPAPAAKPAAPAAPVTAGPDQEVSKLVGMRKMIADAMVRSSQVPVVSTLIDVDVTGLVNFRSTNKDNFLATNGVKLTYTPFFIKALAECLMEFPMLNAALEGDQIIKNNRVHMGVAVSLGEDGSGGLIVPVIRNCESKSLVDIAKDLEGIAKAARGNSLGVEDVKGGTFTLTNPGSYGAVLGTPMINAPQSGIAGVYGIKETPVIINGMIAVRSIMNVVLTYDHRLVDGLTAGRFLQRFKSKLENFEFFK
ncbi:MAG: 2-oxo acid dehydrogenase subunit E2 [Armatimonadetes bacterium]|nr:2-oxo acid dehydrogenase subunit E2 [Armatimonadota bacterium]